MLTPDSFLWKALEFYGTRVQHRGKWRLHEGLRKALKINYSGEFEVSRQGLKWKLNPADFVQSSFYWTGQFEGWDWHHLSDLLPPNSVVFDVGANFGYYSLMLANAAGAKVFAFEPNPPTLERLRTNIALNDLAGSITAVPIGLSDTRKSGYLASVAGNSGASHLSAGGTQISLDTLDHYCETNGIARVDFLKVDVEGHETQMLRGAARMLDACRPGLMIEFNPAALKRAGSSAEALEGVLLGLGYQLFLPVRQKLVPFRGSSHSYDVINVFGLHGTP